MTTEDKIDMLEEQIVELENDLMDLEEEIEDAEDGVVEAEEKIEDANRDKEAAENKLDRLNRKQDQAHKRLSKMKKEVEAYYSRTVDQDDEGRYYDTEIKPSKRDKVYTAYVQVDDVTVEELDIVAPTALEAKRIAKAALALDYNPNCKIKSVVAQVGTFIV